MPACRDVSELVTDYLEHALSPGGRLGVRWHLLQCAACRRYVVQMRQTVRLLAAGKFPPPTRETEDGVLNAVRGTPSTPAPGD